MFEQLFGFAERMKNFVVTAFSRIDFTRINNKLTHTYAALKLESRFKALYSDAKSNPKKYAIRSVIAVLTFYIIFGNYGIVQRVRLQYAKHSLLKQLKVEEERNAELEAEIEKANDLDEIERLAREKYNLSQKGETVYTIKK